MLLQTSSVDGTKVLDPADPLTLDGGRTALALSGVRSRGQRPPLGARHLGPIGPSPARALRDDGVDLGAVGDRGEVIRCNRLALPAWRTRCPPPMVLVRASMSRRRAASGTLPPLPSGQPPPRWECHRGPGRQLRWRRHPRQVDLPADGSASAASLAKPSRAVRPVSQPACEADKAAPDSLGCIVVDLAADRPPERG